MSNLTHSDGYGRGTGNLTLLANPELCTLQTCDLTLSSFLYLPTLPGNALFAAIFGILFVGQVFLGIRHRTWGFMIAMLLGLILEIIGYVGRIMLHGSPFNNNDFLIYLVCLTIAPALLTAAIYLCLARIVTVYGASLSRFKPRTYTIIFCGCDLVSLVLQALGGAIASTANTVSSSNLGKNIMIAGLGFQVFSLLLFSALCAEFAWRLRKFQGDWNPKYLQLVQSCLFKMFLCGLVVSVITILARSIYRCVELSGGFNSTLFVSDEAVFMVLEGVMIILAATSLTVLHPAIGFQGAWHETNFTYRTKKASLTKIEQANSDEESQRRETLELGEMQTARGL